MHVIISVNAVRIKYEFLVEYPKLILMVNLKNFYKII